LQTNHPCSINITIVGYLHMIQNSLIYLRADSTWPLLLLLLLAVMSTHDMGLNSFKHRQDMEFSGF
jgi:hypothetical protein